ncbi:Murein DD-endopeptidase MepM [Fundidesulfovibrio magnetotacticus]|uniref:Murein DD-endopeptidase MepM n=1 Tax=Fundidesulfovibrio magnetotacticus TaxID=2730080 RepID=A0A6V8LNG0_9BACT|nr:M23 family metallopeptidase [Fundidesulfovibrio magnetotacticus]GFK92540.1 Murein DD-endopeptidase MepM [Fundidesulfovibrio magnetotacticus]
MPTPSRFEIFRDDHGRYRRVSPRKGLALAAVVFLVLVAAGNVWWFAASLTRPALEDDTEERRRLSSLRGPSLEHIEARAREIAEGVARLKEGEERFDALVTLDKEAARAIREARAALGGQQGDESPGDILTRMEMRAAFARAMNRPVKLAVTDGTAIMALLPTGGQPMGAAPDAWPVRGVLSSEFGARLSPFAGQEEFHKGVDIMAPAGSPVRAPAPGVVTFAGRDAEGSLALVLDHGGGYTTLFSHLQGLDAKAGDPVLRGQAIASVGTEGRSTGPHLHYEVRLFGVPVNPAPYLGQAPRAAQP